MTEIRHLTEEQIAQLKAPFGPEMISPNPRKTFLSTIKAYAIIERLNEVFGVGRWQLHTDYISTYQKKEVTREGKERDVYEVLAKATLDIPEYGIHLEQLGGGEDFVLGDAAKGAVTDALNKNASYLYIGYDVFMGNVPAQTTKSQPTQAAPVKRNVDFNMLRNANSIEELTKLYNEYVKDMSNGKAKDIALEILSERKKALQTSAPVSFDTNLQYND